MTILDKAKKKFLQETVSHIRTQSSEYKLSPDAGNKV
jgi:hypothetical protein